MDDKKTPRLTSVSAFCQMAWHRKFHCNQLAEITSIPYILWLEIAMKRVIIVPVTETRQFAGMKILARGGSIVELVGDTFAERTRSAWDLEDSFFYSVAGGQADLYTFNTLEEAARFAKGKIEALMAVERSVDTNRTGATGSLKIGPLAVPSPRRRRKRA